MIESELFRKHFPTIEDKQIVDSIAHEGLVVSLVGRKSDANVFAVKFATEKKNYLPIVLTETAAKMLSRLLSQEGY